MTLPRIATRDEWRAEREKLLLEEKEFNRARDALSARRRQLPMVEVDKEYLFDGPNGTVDLAGLFEGRRQLVVYHFMFDPKWDEGCKACSFFADNIGHLSHLHARDTTLALVSRAPLAKLLAFRERMGWELPWYSSAGSDFNYDYHVTLDESVAPVEYNYKDKDELIASGEKWRLGSEKHGMSAFLRDGDRLFHTYSTYARGPEMLFTTYNLLDFTALGRQEKKGAGMAWVRLHDRY
jgi:predicted dithiol-disulfide oxidoreductase (DUF899 family)